MIWTSELILLAPRILKKRGPLEHSCFIGLFTSIKDEYSKGLIYLVYKFDYGYQEKDIEGSINNEQYYYNKRVIYIGDTRYIVFVFRNNEIETHKDYGNIGYDIYDYTLIYTFWGNRTSEINYISNTYIRECKRQIDKEKGLDVNRALYYFILLVSNFYSNYVYFEYL